VHELVGLRAGASGGDRLPRHIVQDRDTLTHLRDETETGVIESLRTAGALTISALVPTSVKLGTAVPLPLGLQLPRKSVVPGAHTRSALGAIVGAQNGAFDCTPNDPNCTPAPPITR
jgi:hypothetical protein